MSVKKSCYALCLMEDVFKYLVKMSLVNRSIPFINTFIS
ncbi:hypothetical protein LSO9J_40004 [Candidatus Liberibacter solanacearum]